MPPMADAEALELARRVVDLATDKKASDIVLIGVGELTTLADYLVICSGGSERQLGAIADGIVEGLKADGMLPIGREGLPGAHWVLLDLGAVHSGAPSPRSGRRCSDTTGDCQSGSTTDRSNRKRPSCTSG